jgi:hypothetical protein
MKKLSMLLTESSYKDGYRDTAQSIMKTYGSGYNSDWRVFINKVLEHVYTPTNQWKTDKDSEGKVKTGVWTTDGVWHPVLNRINTNFVLMSKLLKYSGINVNQPLPLIYSTFIQFFRQNYRSIVSEDGEIYMSIVLPTIDRTSVKGEKTEEESINLLKDCPLFNGLNVVKVGGSGVVDDMINGVDAVVYKDVVTIPTYTIQIKPFTDIKESDYGHFINGVGAAKQYKTDFIAFVKQNSLILVDSKSAKPLKGSYFISKLGIKYQKGVDSLNENFDIIKNILKFI